jgi:hypothetical protein
VGVLTATSPTRVKEPSRQSRRGGLTFVILLAPFARAR